MVTSSKMVLIVDDDLAIRSSLADLLGDEGYDTACAGDGRAALDYLDQGVSPRLILLDLMMPIMDGWDFRTEQQRRNVCASIPLVIMTASGRCDEAVLSLGAQDCVEKPFSFARLLTVVRRHLLV